MVAEIEAEQELVAVDRELMTHFEKKIQAALARVWGDDSEGAKAQVANSLSGSAKNPRRPVIIRCRRSSHGPALLFSEALMRTDCWS